MKSVRILMERLANYDVYENFSWSGKSGILKDNVTKLVFSDLEGVIKLVINTINMKSSEPRGSVIKTLKDFCKRSSQNKKRVEDKQRKAEENETAADKWKVTKSTLQRRCKNQNLGRYGRPTVLKKAEEDDLIRGLTTAAEWGFPLSHFKIRCIVKQYLDSKGVVEKRFKYNFPGPDWLLSQYSLHDSESSVGPMDFDNVDIEENREDFDQSDIEENMTLAIRRKFKK
ncbi:unnamed protein product [Brassicogethes aeneus]|uniref:DUF4806 domain-containing protein n=1 Tax=Brassicogethes aeneus TaxID=1431903 RepID=A0A9P0BH31_BRAAE|nr:unnamed protein product [Brassicogethes aeneus]